MNPQSAIRNPQSVVSAVNSFPHIEQYSGVWAMHEPAFLAALEQLRSSDLAAHISLSANPQSAIRNPQSAEPPLFERVDGGVAVIDMIGPFTKFGSSFSSNPGYLRLRQAVRAAVSEQTIEAIVLRIDSPGGVVTGLDDLAQEVTKASKIKPVVAFIEDLGASAAYYVASQAGHIVANTAAIVGSIGTYAVLKDWSALFAREGVKVHIIKSGQFKGAGERGTEITGEQLDETQRLVDQFHALFVAAVAKGRGLSMGTVRKLADGRVHVGAEAKNLGLVDAVGGLEETIESLGASNDVFRSAVLHNRQQELDVGDLPASKLVGQAGPIDQYRKDETMTDQKPGAEGTTELRSSPPAATVAELKKGFPDMNAEWREGMTELDATMADATGFHAEELKKRNDALAKENEKLKAATKREGVEPVGTKTTNGSAGGEAEGFDGDAIEQFDGAVRKRTAAGMERKQAVIAVARANPELHCEYLKATNPRQVHDLIDQRQSVG